MMRVIADQAEGFHMRCYVQLIRWTTFLGLISVSIGASAAEIHVSPRGNDQNSGTLDQPLATLAGARDRIRSWRRQSNWTPAPIAVTLHAGRYALESHFELSAEDSGAPAAPIVYRAATGEDVRLTGGIAIADFRRVQDPRILARMTPEARDALLVATIPEESLSQFEPMGPRSYLRAMTPAAPELFASGEPMPLARWPNSGWTQTRSVSQQDDEIQFSGDRELVGVLHEGESVWVHGFWSDDGIDGHEPATVLADGGLRLAASDVASLVRNKARFRILDSLGLLDSPGEWYLDRQSRHLYFWPPGNLSLADVQLSCSPTVISLYGAHHITLDGLTIECARSMGVEIAGGSDVLLTNCVVRNTGNLAIHIFGGTHHRVENCDISGSGEGALRVEGGDERSLQACDHHIVNNHLHHFSHWTYANRPGILLYGVGTTIRNNLIHDGPHAAILVHGNNHLIEHNEIHTCCTETTLTGAIHLAGGWTDRGNVIQYNHLHHLGGFTRRDVMGVYLDHLASGTVVRGNLFRDAVRAIAVGGGRDNVLENNLFVDCLAGIQVDCRGETWCRSVVEDPNSELQKHLAAVVGESLPLLKEHPELATLLQDQPGRAKGNRIVRNIGTGRRTIDLHDGLSKTEVVLDSNLAGVDPAFVDREAGDFRLSAESPAWGIGFARLPLEAMGLQGPHGVPQQATLAEKD